MFKVNWLPASTEQQAVEPPEQQERHQVGQERQDDLVNSHGARRQDDGRHGQQQDGCNRSLFHLPERVAAEPLHCWVLSRSTGRSGRHC